MMAVSVLTMAVHLKSSCFLLNPMHADMEPTLWMEMWNLDVLHHVCEGSQGLRATDADMLPSMLLENSSWWRTLAGSVVKTC